MPKPDIGSKIPPVPLSDLKVVATLDYVKAYCEVKYAEPFPKTRRWRWTPANDHHGGHILTVHDPTAEELVHVVRELQEPLIWGFECGRRLEFVFFRPV